MHIEIFDRFRPYSQTPGSICVLPRSHYAVQVFPGLIKIHDASQSTIKELFSITLDLKSPIEKFMIMMDLEKGEISVQGFAQDGFLSYVIKSGKLGHGVKFQLKKAPLTGIKIHDGSCWKLLKAKDFLVFLGYNESQETFDHLERLSLGNNKAQDWDLVTRRLDLKEIFPIWNRLGQMIEDRFIATETGGNIKLFEDCKAVIANKEIEKIEETFLKLFKAAFYGILMPQLNDNKFQCLSSFVDNFPINLSPLFFLSQGSLLIRSLFIQERESEISILPALPPCFSSGRLIQVRTKKGLISIEWSKKTIRRVIFAAFETDELLLKFRNVNSCRLRKGENDKGEKFVVNHSLQIEKNSLYFFDNFS